MVLRKKFPTPKDAEKAMAQKEAVTEATHVPTSVGDDQLLTEGIDALKISYVRIICKICRFTDGIISFRWILAKML